MNIEIPLRLFSPLLVFLVAPLLDGADSKPPRWPEMPYILTEPGPEHAAENRMFVCSAGGVAVAPNGRIWASWDSGGYGEGQYNFIFLASSDDGGKTWSEPKMIIDPPFRASYSGLWIDPEGRLWFTFSLWPVRNAREDWTTMEERFDDIRAYKTFLGENQGQGSQFWAITTDDPGAASPEWNRPRLLATEYGHMNEPTVLSDGTWVFPTGTIVRDQDRGRKKLLRPLFSDDQGESFHFRGHVPVPKGDRNADELQVVERADGSLWLLCRTSYGIGESFSYDQGYTWTEMQPSGIPHPVARFYIGRLESGKLLLVKHGPMDEEVTEEERLFHTRHRDRLTAFLSDDDGETWSGGLMIDERNGVSYPDAAQDAEGNIYVVYDYQRHHAKEILMAVFTEEDIEAGEPVSEVARFRQIVDKALARNTRHDPLQPGQKEAVPQWKLDANVEEAEAAASDAPVIVPGAAVADLQPGVTLFQDRRYRLAELPDNLRGARFLRVEIDGPKTLEAREATTLFLATPHPDSPHFSLSEPLLRRGFERVEMPLIQLFGTNPNSRCAVYRKTLEPGETLRFGKWAVPIFFE
jgi:hypothetical protein